MKKVFALFVAMFVAQQFCVAQNLKFGKPTKSEWEMTSWSEAPDAPAVLLCKNLSLNYGLSASFSSYGNGSDIDTDGATFGRNNIFTNEGTTMTYTVNMRTKILKDEGKDYANFDVLYYSSTQDMNLCEEFYSFKVTLFKMVNGKVKKQNLDKSYKDERISNDFIVRHVRIPQAEVGDIVEVQYELFSPRIAYIYDWQFQDEIPVLYSNCELKIPSYLTFNVNAAIRNNITSKVEAGSISYKKESTDLLAPKTCFANVYRMESRDMLPWSMDPIRKTAGSAIAQVKCTIANATIQGIPYPLSQPEGMKWITLSPKNNQNK